MTIMDFINNYIRALFTDTFFRVMVVMILLDIFFGFIRGWKERCFNSSFGIDGGRRKIGMIGGVLLLMLVDLLLNINIFALLPADTQDFLTAAGFAKVGIMEFFAVLYTVCEAVSVLKNMVLCGLPVPKGIRCWAETFLDTMTDELDARPAPIQRNTGEVPPEYV